MRNGLTALRARREFDLRLIAAMESRLEVLLAENETMFAANTKVEIDRIKRSVTEIERLLREKLD